LRRKIFIQRVGDEMWIRCQIAQRWSWPDNLTRHRRNIMELTQTRQGPVQNAHANQTTIKYTKESIYHLRTTIEILML